MVVEIALAAIILLLLTWMHLSGGIFQRRRLSAELDNLRKEVSRLRDANEALRGASDAGWTKGAEELCEFVRELEMLKSSVAGSRSCWEKLSQKYKAEPDPQMVELIIDSWHGMDGHTKRRLADELLVGEVGRSILRSLGAGASVEESALNAGIPIAMARSHIVRLRTLGYLDSSLRPTALGQRALAQDLSTPL